MIGFSQIKQSKVGWTFTFRSGARLQRKRVVRLTREELETIRSLSDIVSRKK